MRRILVEKGIPVGSHEAILKTLEAAVDFQLAELDIVLKAMEKQSYDTLDLLIETLKQLRDAIAKLPTLERS
jgi:hypothetical protein